MAKMKWLLLKQHVITLMPESNENSPGVCCFA